MHDACVNAAGKQLKGCVRSCELRTTSKPMSPASQRCGRQQPFIQVRSASLGTAVRASTTAMPTTPAPRQKRCSLLSDTIPKQPVRVAEGR